MFSFLTKLPRSIKGLLFLISDMVLIVFSLFVATALRLNSLWPIDFFLRSVDLLFVLLCAAIVYTYTLRIHLRKLGGFDFSGVSDMAIWVTLLTLTGFVSNLYFDLGAPRTVPLIFGPLMLVSVFALRLSAYKLLKIFDDWGSEKIPIAIYGAGAAGHQLVSALRDSREYKPAIFVDDNRHLQGVNISGLRVYHPASLKKFLRLGRIEKVFLAIPSVSRIQRKRMVRSLVDLGCEVQEVPSYVDMIQSGGVINSLKPIEPEALLGRDDVLVSVPETESVYKNANVLISGAGGSIGSELCRQVLEIQPAKLVLLEVSEIALYSIEQELRALATKINAELVPVLGSVVNENFVQNLIKAQEIEVILHAAAYKHVPLVEANILEGLRNNVFGTKVLAEAAAKCGVRRFTLISTDKAVRPTNAMGASKRLSELIIQDCYNQDTNTIFSIVRFGNVLGSSGSVIPLFKRQIARGGPVTVTDSNVTRYFMTISEAARLVLLASSFADGGEVFVLDMGEPVKIVDLAKQMIELSGSSPKDENNPDGDIAIEFVGLRPGEKLYEELLIGKNSLPTPHEKILRAREASMETKDLRKAIQVLEDAIEKNDTINAQKILKQCVEGYISS